MLMRTAACVAGVVGVLVTSACSSRLRRAVRDAPAPDVPALRAASRPLTPSSCASWAAKQAARIVAVGEPTHGSKQPRELFACVVRALAKEDGGLVVFGEWCESEGREIDAYIDDPTEGKPPRVAGPVMWSGTFERLWKELGTSAVGGPSRIHVLGMRPCRTEDHVSEIENAVRSLGPERANLVSSLLAAGKRNPRGTEDAIADQLPDASPAVRWQLQLWRQTLERPSVAYSDDEAMAENVRFVLQHLFPSARAVITAHNGHVVHRESGELLPNGRRMSVPTLGQVLRRWYGAGYVAVASLTGDGEFCAVPASARRHQRTRRYPLRHPHGAVEHELASVSDHPWILDTQSVSEAALPAGVFVGGRGYTWGWPWRWLRIGEYRERDLRADFDALAYFPSSAPDRLPGCVRSSG